ncbi:MULTISPECIES: precorrin-3B C(17)-methyltransferase [Methylococcus]|uniref:Precorrin-3B C(17)-methyltransferase n=1 Tax=Methylococcus capsulatus TaxID=414 RepID=A0ABZ2F1J7_METCP|nr:MULTISPECIES: precorrin-3B C(17)-methyltransferase [Methylococcus]MDF9391522.1 precorrin-3B C(17)-methyltransferase [Methylococcus capsulatus]
MNKGKILLVGFGPGAPEHMTYRAREAIAEADVVIGYSTYIKLVQELLDGKEVVRKGMTEEIDRCVEAYEHAREGKTVALISSGDIGIYGMAGPTFEVLLQAGWTPAGGIAVEVIPGATALNACAALVGAPLTHDFCAISLSDLLTPWPVIARRLEAAARGDFVVALYNPKSGRRTRQIVEAQRILLRHRRKDTPVAIVKSAYRRRQNIQMTTLSAMTDCDIGMLCTVLIGNRSTVVREGLMITPRGYANKYDALTGPAKDGERAGHSLGMGLAGWHGGVRRWLRDDPERSLREAARHFDAPLGEILAAVGAAQPDDEAGTHRATAVAQQDLDAVLDGARHWGRLRAVVRSEGGGVAELLCDAQDFSRRGDWLNLVNPHFHLHADLSRVRGLWFYSREHRQHGVYFLDEGGDTVFSLLLIQADGNFDAVALSHFHQSRELYGQPFVPVDEAPEPETETDD